MNKVKKQQGICSSWDAKIGNLSGKKRSEIQYIGLLKESPFSYFTGKFICFFRG